MRRGTASALYAGHRLSQDTDHLLISLRDSFEGGALAIGSATGMEKTARTTSSPHSWQFGRCRSWLPVNSNVTPSVRESIVETEAGPLVVPTWDELIAMKAFLAYDRNVTRDYLDFAAFPSARTSLPCWTHCLNWMFATDRCKLHPSGWKLLRR